ncbi:tetratricopeptide repeat protein [Prochlorococcus marinus]|uniref:tetratricopeptide repeat protein n=1 Tax=Prochlorococcus marinus TaxID=1219 RepID=UPI0022B41863|nr:tetratricopeptide repeat protein [Prochlorococcus marinus]
MELTEKETDQKQKVPELKTFAVPFTLGEVKENITININSPYKPSKEELIKKAFKFHSEGNIPEAVKYYQIFINQGFEDYRVFSNYGIILKGFGKLKEAEISYRKAIELNPDFADSHLYLGNILSDLNYLEEAELSTRKAIQLNPNLTEAHSNLGNVLRDLGNLKEAEISYRKAIELNPKFPEAYSNLGNIFSDLGKLKEAETLYRKAIELNPDFADVHCNLGILLRDIGKLKQAEISTRKAIELRPEWGEAHHNLSSILLKLKQFKEGWNHFEWRWKMSNSKLSIGKKLRTTKPVWTIESKGRVLLWPEQGVGDEIFFSSMIPELEKKVDHLIVMADKRLIAIFKRSFDRRIVYVNKDSYVEEDKYDFQIPMGSLPKIFRENEESFKRVPENYLKVDDIKASNIRNRIQNPNYEKIVGISWKTIAKAKKSRSLELEELILGIYSPKIKFICLQYGDVEKEVYNLKNKHGVEIELVNDIDKFNDIDGLSSLISACDEIVTIDNSTVILAGAIGSKCNLLIPINSHWYWGLNEIKSYWFPSIKLFRKQNFKTWNEPLKSIKKQINPYK